MDNISFEQLPQAVLQIFKKLENIEGILNTKQKTQVVEEDKLLTIQEAAEFLHVAVPTLYNYVQNKVVPFSKKSKRLYFSKNELREWIKEGRQRTRSEIQIENEVFLNSKRK